MELVTNLLYFRSIKMIEHKYITKMGKRLTKEAVLAVQNDPDLFRDVCKSIEVKPESLSVMLRRNTSRKLIAHDVVIRIAKVTGIRTTQVMEDATTAA